MRRKVVFPGGKGRPQITGVVASDGTVGTMGKAVGKRQGAKLDMRQVEGISQGQLNELSKEIQDVKGFGGAVRAPKP